MLCALEDFLLAQLRGIMPTDAPILRIDTDAATADQALLDREGRAEQVGEAAHQRLAFIQRAAFEHEELKERCMPPADFDHFTGHRTLGRRMQRDKGPDPFDG